MTLGLSVVLAGQRSLRDQRTDAQIVGLVGEVRQLLVRDGQIGAQLRQTLAHGAESAFNEDGHAGIVWVDPGLLLSARSDGDWSGDADSDRLVPMRSDIGAVLICLASLLPMAACGDDSPKAECGPSTVEQVDSRLYHLLPTSPSPSYLTDPPTSGPHVSGLRVTGVQSRVLTGIEQVSTLELNIVIVQYGSKLAADDRAGLERLAGDEVTVAPSGVDDDRVIVTGWMTKMTCAGSNPDAVTAFIAAYRKSSIAPGPGN